MDRENAFSHGVEGAWSSGSSTEVMQGSRADIVIRDFYSRAFNFTDNIVIYTTTML